MNKSQVGNKLRSQAFLDGKTNSCKHNIYGPRRHDIVVHDHLYSM